jgi:ABC-type sugar transport system ATPase subunit
MWRNHFGDLSYSSRDEPTTPTSAGEQPPLTPTSGSPLLTISGLSKTFPGQKALDDVAIVLHEGEIHALLGQNGCGKSTLIKVLTGFHDADPGARIMVHDEEAAFTPHGPTTARGKTLFIRAVHQDMGLIGGLSIVDNVAMIIGYERSRFGRIKWAAQESRTRELLATVGAQDLDVQAPVQSCTPLQQTQIAIARAIYGWEGQHGLLILDEPTASLPASQSEGLFALIRALRDSGVAILYVSHRLGEVFHLADRATVLRGGRLVTSTGIGELDHSRLVEFMLGSAASEDRQEAGLNESRQAVVDPVTPAEQVVAMRVIGLQGDRIDSLSFHVCRGEVLGFAGLVGSGQEELPYLLVGGKRSFRGELQISGLTVDAKRMSPRRARDLGIALVPADRVNEAVMPQKDVMENISLPQVAAFQSAGWLHVARERAFADEWAKRLSVAPEGTAALVTSLSGGNQQKVILARWLAVARTALVLAEPTAGVDIGAKTLLYEQLRRHSSGGLPIIVCSTDVMDLVEVCTRVIVLRDGRAVGELCGAEITEDSIMRVMLIETKVPAA